MVRDQSLTKPRFFDIETEVDNRAAYLDPLFDLLGLIWTNFIIFCNIFCM